MDIYQVLEGWTVLVVLLALFALLFLQIAMLLHFRQISFLLFSIGAALGIVYSVLSAVPFYLPISNSQRLLIFQSACIAAAGGVILGVLGTISLFRTYRKLVKVTAPESPGRAG